ncbi:MAG: hypothetical protein ACC657_14490 [Thiohalomonadales bacterium]
MSKLLLLVHNGEIKIEYACNKPLAGIQRRFLEKMDTDMDNGIKINGKPVLNPDKMQRVQYVTNHLVNSFLNNKEQLISAAYAYLAKTVPELKQIRVDTTSEHDSIDLVFDDEK